MNELLLPKRRSATSDSADLSGYVERIGLSANSVEEIAERFPGVEIMYFSSFNDDDCIEALAAIDPEYGVFTGGGIVKAPTLEKFAVGIIHAHPGVLPQYKGMDVVQWAILEGRYDAVGSTCQIMSPALDAGRLLSNQLVDPSPCRNLNEIRTAVVEEKIGLLAETVSDFVRGAIGPVEHPPGGRLYMHMHPELVSAVSLILENGLHRAAPD